MLTLLPLPLLPLPLLPADAREIAPGVGVVTGRDGGLVVVHGLATFAWDRLVFGRRGEHDRGVQVDHRHAGQLTGGQPQPREAPQPAREQAPPAPAEPSHCGVEPGQLSSPAIGIEEPEITLHPAAAGVLFDALTEASERVQVVVTTQSADLLDRKDLDVSAVRPVSTGGGLTVIGEVDQASRHIVRDKLYTLGELVRGQLSPEPAPGPQAASPEA